MARKRQKRSHFGYWMLVYGVFLSSLFYFGLQEFREFLVAYEASRPQHTVDAYMDSLNMEKIGRDAGEFLSLVDEDLQPRQESLEVIEKSLQEGLRCVPKFGGSAGEHRYAVRCGSRTIGEFSIVQTDTDSFNFPVWAVGESRFAFTDLYGDPQSITVPSAYHVYANGRLLGEAFQTETGVHFARLEAYYDSFDMPTMTTYRVQDYLGTMELTVEDEAGNPVQPMEDWDPILNNCTQEQQKKLETHLNGFLDAFLRYSGSQAGQAQKNLTALRKYVTAELAKRLNSALIGLSYTQNKGHTIVSVTFNTLMQVNEDTYFADMSYEVDIRSNTGVVRVENNMKVFLHESDGALVVESFESY